jgi:hypothetical protein
MTDTPGPCRHEVFYNKLGSTGAVVCSCGFAATYTRLGSEPEKLGMEFFERMHERRDRLILASPDLLKELKNLRAALQACQFVADGESRKMIREYLADADVAIAKVEGVPA